MMYRLIIFRLVEILSTSIGILWIIYFRTVNKNEGEFVPRSRECDHRPSIFSKFRPSVTKQLPKYLFGQAIDHLFHQDNLTESLALPWEYRPTSKWPTMIFFCLNKQMVPKDHPVKFFSIFFRGKGGIFALKVRVASKKNNKIELTTPAGNRTRDYCVRDSYLIH